MAKSQEDVVKLRPLNVRRIKLTIEGISPMVQHKWSTKAIDMIRDKKMGKKSKNRDVVSPEEEFEACMYKTHEGRHAVPVSAMRECVVGAAHKDLGIEKTLVRKGLFFICDPIDQMLPMVCDKPHMENPAGTPVRVGNGAADLRWRPQFDRWEVPLEIEYDAELLRPDDIVNLLNRAGFSVGLGEMRPEKKIGTYGRFRVKTT